VAKSHDYTTIFYMKNLIIFLLLTPIFTNGQSLTRAFPTFRFDHLAIVPDESAWFAAGSKATNIEGNGITVCKFGPNGNVLWSKQIMGKRDADGLAAMEDGSVLVFGNNTDVNNYFDPTIVHLDADGTWLSERVFGTPDNVERWDNVQQFSDGRVVAIVNEFVGFDDLITIYLFDATGQLTWVKAYSHDIFGDFDAIIEGDNEEIIITGRGNWTDFPGNVLLRLDAEGEIAGWDVFISETFELQMTAGKKLADGSIVLTGQGLDFGHFAAMKISTTGEVEWTQDINGGFDFYRIAQTHPDTILVATTSPIDDPDVSSTDYLLYKFLSDGTLAGTTRFGSDATDTPYRMLSKGDTLIWAGNSNGWGDPDTFMATLTLQLGNSICDRPFTPGEITPLDVKASIAEFNFVPAVINEPTNFEGTVVDWTVDPNIVCSDIVSTLSPANCALPSGLKTWQDWLLFLNQQQLAAVTPIQISDIAGRVISQNVNTIDMSLLRGGMYFYNFEIMYCGKKQLVSGKIIITE
jgi:hypothetical protein